MMLCTPSPPTIRWQGLQIAFIIDVGRQRPLPVTAGLESATSIDRLQDDVLS